MFEVLRNNGFNLELFLWTLTSSHVSCCSFDCVVSFCGLRLMKLSYYFLPSPVSRVGCSYGALFVWISLIKILKGFHLLHRPLLIMKCKILFTPVPDLICRSENYFQSYSSETIGLFWKLQINIMQMHTIWVISEEAHKNVYLLESEDFSFGCLTSLN